MGAQTNIYGQKSDVKVIYWPTPQDYNEAVQNLQGSVQDADLKFGEVGTDKMGLPRPITGAFASVYQVHSAGRNWALRCFLRDVPDACHRYASISDFVQHDTLSYTVGFDYQQEGIKVNGKWFPILKMEWVNGATLDNYLHKAIGAGSLPASMTQRFKTMCLDLRAAGIAHGDLQHGNIMVHDDELFLVDYDGMYVPALAGSLSNELGHRNYQHPKRNERTFGPYLDNFSAWIIHTSLQAMAIDPSLYQRLGAGEDCLLFRHDDFVNPLNSCAFNVLEKHAHEEVRQAARFIRWQLERPPEQVPALDTIPEVPSSLAPLREDAPDSRVQPSIVAEPSGIPDWMQSQLHGTLGGDFQARASYSASSFLHPSHQASTHSQPQSNQPPQTYPVEQELRSAPPRKVAYNSGAGLLNPWIWQVLGLALIFMMGIMGMQWSDYLNLAKNGVDVQGTIYGTTLVHRSKEPDQYRIRYQYDYNDVHYYSSREISINRGRLLSDGHIKDIGVRVLPSKPGINSPDFTSPLHGMGANWFYSDSELPDQTNSSSGSFWALLLVNVFLEFGIWSTPMKHKRLVSYGKAVRGHIFDKQVRTGSKGAKSYYLHYDYPNTTGRMVQDTMKVTGIQFDSISKGDEVTVVWLPDTGLSAIYPFCYYRAV